MHIVTIYPCVVLFLTIFFSTVSYASPTSETFAAAETVDADVPVAFADPWPAHSGIAPYFGRQTLWLRKRQCLENGSNFCFDDSNRMCPDCGGCCELDGASWCCPEEGDTCCPGETCCKADETCCGDGCCPDGSKCSDGRCEASGVSSVTVTSTKTAHATRTHSEVEVITVQVKVRVTSTVNSIVTTTITSESGTQTDVTYETTTMIEKRELPAPAFERRITDLNPNMDDAQGIVGRVFSNPWKKLVLGDHLQRPEHDGLLLSLTEPRKCLTTLPPEIQRRQDDGDDDTSTVTVTVTTTKFDETTVEDSRTTTDLVTTTVTKTIYQTSTSVVGARDTVSVTSTVVITNRRPTTDTITSTSTDFINPTEGAAGPATTPSLVDEEEDSSSSGLSTPAMIGLGVGVGCAAILLAAVAIVLLRRSRKKKNKPLVPDYIIAPPPAPIPSQRRDAYFASMEKSPGHSRGMSTTTQDSSGASSDNRGAMPERSARRSIPHPSTSTVGKKTRFAELEGQGPGGMG